ncbi:PD-(D/E)XK motif protein [Brevundimonas subvibrioides]|uniref:PD-(D/E)XK motif protein n=1 Tax=Brevundimonas subvibrioides TaxID=74313 RepID=UPI0022B356A7|nr:PD-(D/E)XK motif protein [Brevundimonas subvibrioides]
MADQWDTIPRAAAAGSRTERLADPEHALDFFRGRDFEGRHLFWLSVDWQGDELPKCPTLSGIEAECQPEGAGTRLTLALRDSGQLEVFAALCANLMDATRHLTSEGGKQALHVVVARLRRWQELLGRRRDNILTRQAIIGLVGELLVFRDQVLSRLPAGEAALCWRGPFSDEQDFVFGGRILEVKTQLATADRRFQIASEHQLDTTSGPITLVHQLIGAGANDPAARSLNELVAEISSTIRERSPDALDLFNAGIIEVGYVVRSEYDAEAWAPAGLRVYEILDGFPRIAARGLPAGISRVQYEVSLSFCGDFERPIEWLEKVVLG